MALRKVLVENTLLKSGPYMEGKMKPIQSDNSTPSKKYKKISREMKYIIGRVANCFEFLWHIVNADVLNTYVIWLEFHNKVPVFSMSRM